MTHKEIQDLDLKNSDPKTTELWGMFGKPLKLLANSGKAGLKAVKSFALILVMMIVSNVIFLSLALFKYFSEDTPTNAISWVVICLLIGFACTAFAAYRGYQFLVIEVMNQLYKSMRGIFEKLSDTVVEKTSILMQKKEEIGPEEFNKEISLIAIVKEKYSKTPRLFRRGLVLLLSRVPLFPYIQAVHNDIAANRNEVATKKLHGSLDSFMEEEIFAKNSNQWMLIIFLINVLACMLIITYKFG